VIDRSRLRPFLLALGLGAAVIGAAGAVVGAIWGVSWGDGIGAVCVAGTALWLAIAVVAFLRWLVAGRAGPSLRAGLAAAATTLVMAGVLVEAPYRAYDGCSWYSGDQPLLTVPVSYVVEKPVWARDSGLFDPIGCQYERGRAYEVRL
jgi:hypothetical protein